jgi:hypothetical protein
VSAPRVTDAPCQALVWVDEADHDKGVRRCGKPVPKHDWPHDRTWPVACEDCLRRNQQR